MSTRLFLIFIVVVAVLGVVYYTTAPTPAAQPTTETPTTTPSQLQSYTSVKYGLSFDYSASYQLTEIDNDNALREHHTIILQRKADLPPPQGGEGPPSITIDIFQNNLDNRTTEDWIRGDSRSNFKLGEMTIASTTVDGEHALSYRWSGLYEGTTIAIAQPDWIYAFSVTYLEIGADIVQDFVAIRDSVRIQ